MKVDLENIFFDSCQSGNLDKVKACVTLGFNVNSVSYLDQTGLKIAINKDNLELLEYLLSCCGVDVNKESEGYTPLMQACCQGKDRIVRRLSQVPGIEVNYQTSSGMSAADVAAVYGQTECIRILSNVEEVDWNLKDNMFVLTPLAWALDKNHAECAEIIVSIPGVDLAVTDKYGWTLTHHAAGGGVDSVQVLLGLEGIMWNEKNYDGDTPVMVAFMNKKYDVVKLLITDVNVDTEIRNNEGNTLEDLARHAGVTDILEILPSRADMRVRELEEQLRRANLKMQRNIPECPVCLEQFERNTRIYICVNGHFICNDCKTRMPSQSCPKCKQNICGRATDFENFLSERDY